ncbi:MAG TPA: low molecular weight protein-tyrosine-phosphatase [Edaphocola sp.]|nr:low molecular weight protein-tyrosine-phosphatase [Edaphocola sp.]
MKLLMVCLGNICRSPMAEGIMKAMLKEKGLDWEVASSGINGYHTGESPHPSSQKVCKQHGYDISSQRATRFASEDFEDYDKIYVMAADVYRDVIRLAPYNAAKEKVSFFLEDLYSGTQKDVLDPWFGGDEGYLPVFKEIEAGCKSILENLISKY